MCTGARPQACSSAQRAASYTGPSRSPRHGSPASPSVTSTRAPHGACPAGARRSASKAAAGSCPGGTRRLNLRRPRGSRVFDDVATRRRVDARDGQRRARPQPRLQPAACPSSRTPSSTPASARSRSSAYPRSSASAARQALDGDVAVVVPGVASSRSIAVSGVGHGAAVHPRVHGVVEGADRRRRRPPGRAGSVVRRRHADPPVAGVGDDDHVGREPSRCSARNALEASASRSPPRPRRRP